MITIHHGELRRWSVAVRCVSHSRIWRTENGGMTNRATMVVFAPDKNNAALAACEKIEDKFLRHQNKQTTWVVAGEPVEC